VANLKDLRSSIEIMSNDLFVVIGIPFEKTSELQRQLLASFAFGMTFAIAQIERLTPPEVHALAITMLMDSFKYTENQSAAFAQQLIECGSGGGNSTINAVIHRGIDGHRQYQSAKREELHANLESIFSVVGA
jgi:hypothetical protein